MMTDTLELDGARPLTPRRARAVAPFGHLALRPGDTLVDEPDEDSAARLANARLGGLVGGAYRLVKVLGAGSAGAVFRARHEPTGQAVAVKLLHEKNRKDRDHELRFVREAQMASAMQHPNIVRLIEAGRDADGTLYQVLELLQGQPLSAVMEERRLSAAEAVEVGRQLLRALDAVHERGYVHRDVKPENVFLSQVPGGGLCVKLLDFGIAKPVDPQGQPWITMEGVILGTPHYMSPEQITGELPVTAASDLWAVGCVLYEALSGRAPFDDRSLGRILYKIAKDDPENLSVLRDDVPLPLAHAIARALQKQPSRRFSSAREMGAALSVSGASIADLDWDD